ncbi:unnamed protein product [Eruca vesicaria subsp. sativa]|uniref:Uncharacterized protein n=1 Tax=Eruca vesicaria subsp. sativa TaxID=29727 RepID=A0ABC8KF35_ERUVS|nr:unnamed protein product [Eruca vesicaria subsp. sativa]
MTRSVMLVTRVNPKLFGGNLFLNSMQGTRFFFCTALFQSSNGVEDVLPSCLEDLTGREFVFQIRVTSFNFTPNQRTFTVSTLTEDATMENHDQEHGRSILSGSAGDAESGTSSSEPSSLGLKGGEEFAGEDPPEISVGHKKRKRGRE